MTIAVTKQGLQGRQLGCTQLNISVNGTAATPVASGPDAFFVSSITDSGAGSYIINLREPSKLALVVTGFVPLTIDGVVTVSSTTTSTITVATKASVRASRTIQNLIYTAVAYGTGGNSVSIAYTNTVLAGSEVATVLGNAISVAIESGVSTATRVLDAINASAPALALVSAVITGTASTAQVTVGATLLTGGLQSTAADVDFNIQFQFFDQVAYYL